MDAIAILTGGGPAPGMNTVVGSVAKTFLEKGYRVLGLHCGYSSLFTKNPRITEIDFLLADDIFNLGRIVPDDEPLQTVGQELRGGFQSGPVCRRITSNCW